MRELIIDALMDSAKMIPFLLFVYLIVEWLEYKYGTSIRSRIKRAAKAGPLVGAAFGCVPQCGFSVLASAMYTRGVITVGTLIAVFLSTSDEAIPVILAQPGKIRLIVPLICAKVVIAVIGGYGADLLLQSYRKKRIAAELDDHDDHDHDDDHDHYDDHDEDVHEKGCCEHHVTGDGNVRELLIHPIVHTLKVFAFVFVVTLGLNYLIDLVGEHHLSALLLQHSPLQPVITAIVGLIPNCAASVAITQVFLKGGISFGSAIAGLCASGGLGLLVLLKENHNLRDTLRVLGILLFISIAAGILIQYFYG